MVRIKYLFIPVFLLFIALACGSDDEVDEISELCPDDECVDCQGHDDCQIGTYCHDGEAVCIEVPCAGEGECDDQQIRCDLELGRCVPDVCEPGQTECDGDQILQCNNQGSGYLEPVNCQVGECIDGSCSCDDEADCPGDQVCSDRGCECPADGDPCGENCCGAEEFCAETEVCDGDDCSTVRHCQPVCQGTFCGFDGELCCEGDTPDCGPAGECAPSCEGEGELCGEAFDECCPAGDVCVFGSCRTPGDECEVFSDCDFDEYCDQGLGKCMSDDFPEGLVCEEEIDFDPFDVDELWHWDGVEIDGQAFHHVANTPVVADMTGDGTPEIAFTAYPQGGLQNGALVVADGSDGSTVYVNHHHSLRAREHPAIADIDGDGHPEIVVNTGDGIGLVDDIENCGDPDEDDDGCYLWTADVAGSTLNQAPVIADVTGDGHPEVVYLHSVFDGTTGDVIASAPSGQASMPIVADLTGDGVMEILTAGCAYHVEEGESDLQPLWCNDALPGANTLDADARNYVGVGDIVGGDRQGSPEVIWVGLGDVFVLDESDGEILHQFELPGAVRGGPPVVADFDGDGSAEFGVGGQTCYTVFDLDCLGSDDEDQPGCERPSFADCTPGEDCVVEPCSEVAGGTGDGILWSIEIIDSVTGTGFASAVFDFQGDGRHEVVYGDHCRVFVLDGRTGTPLLTRFASRRANSEMPIVVDVDGDGRSNLVYQANSDLFDRDCEDPIADRPDFFPECHEADPPDYCEVGNVGVFALRDVHDAWVGTRPVWNQHAYHITNIDDDATLPDAVEPPWEQFNSFRANRQGEIPLNSPDVVVSSLQVNALQCPPAIDIRATIQNMGVSGIPSGLPVSLYVFDDVSDGELVETITVDQPISPGGMTTVDFSYEVPTYHFNQSLDFQVVANDDGEDGEPIRDCNPDDAMAEVEDIMCFIEI